MKSDKQHHRTERDRLLALPPEAPLTLCEAATVAQVSLRSLMQLRSLGRGPKVRRLGPKTLRTTLKDTFDWLASFPVEGGAV